MKFHEITVLLKFHNSGAVLALVRYIPNLAIVRKAKCGVRARRVSGECLGSPPLLLLLFGTLLKDHPRAIRSRRPTGILLKRQHVVRPAVAPYAAEVEVPDKG